MSKTLGEKRIRTDFNVSGDDRINHIKIDMANCINQLKDLEPIDGEAGRLQSIALTTIEEAAMWAVKYLTYKVD